MTLILWLYFPYQLRYLECVSCYLDNVSCSSFYPVINYCKDAEHLKMIGSIIALTVVSVCYFAAVVDTYLWLYPPRYYNAGVGHLIILTAWLIIILHNFFCSILLGPGFVPKGWKPEEKDNEKRLQFCSVCKGFKPPRSHHCRICRRCVMKMDHHCPWISTCCGHKNHTNFVLFLFFAPIGCMHGLYICIMTLLYQLLWTTELYNFSIPQVSFSVNAFFLNMFACALAFGTIVAVGILFVQQVKTIITNKTNIEQWIVEKADYRAEQKNMPAFVYPYDLGFCKNVAQVLNWRCTPKGDGYEWPVIEGCTNFTLTIEQLEQKKKKKKKTVLFRASEAYSGYWCPCTKGLCTCLHVPFSDEPRISLQIGDMVEVTRWSKYWLYGNKQLTKQEEDEGKRQRGWFPRRCATRLGKRNNEKRREKND